MQVINGNLQLVMETSDVDTVDIDLPEIKNRLYKITGFFMQINGIAVGNYDVACIASIAANKRTTFGIDEMYKQDVIARKRMQQGVALNGIQTYGFFNLVDFQNEIDPIAPWFDGNELRLLFRQVNELLTSGTVDIAWQMYLDQITASKNALDELFSRRYTPTT